MKYVICSIRDSASDVFAQPFFAPTIESAIRSFRMLINDPQGGLPHSNPEDFALFHLGTYDDGHAVFETHTPNQLALARDMVKPLPLSRA